ncbi:MAG: bifunctional hydroxymethylpyrimidine kinase/phosphomethylpyrimidine kinase [Dissulfurimicrobium sp.]|uniref:bifunctional hydroxymethylpyrimidine kinase/phosphomethylpyrimidine kinase n=1 Tax=Dissulfurimicrobium sp. TaxID=2022436 RepID=UPI00404A8AB4
MRSKRRLLSIAGSDPGGGAGIQQDIKVFTALGVYGSAVITALTIQNTLGVQGVLPVDADFVARQTTAVLKDIRPHAIKTGMLMDSMIIEAVSHAISSSVNDAILVVVDPVMIAKDGTPLLEKEAVCVLKDRLLSIADVITPNIPEAEALLEMRIPDVGVMRKAALDLLRMVKKGGSVVLKGGHLEGSMALDIVATPNGVTELPHDRIQTIHTHGTGCTFSSALAVFLAEGCNVTEAARKAKVFVTTAIRGAFKIGCGIGPTNPIAPLENSLERFDVIRRLEEAADHLSSLPCRALVPEVQINIGYSLPWPDSIMDVAAFPGRIIGFKDGAKAVSCPEFGASSHVARIILTAMSFDPAFRSAMNIRFDGNYIKRAVRLGLTVQEFSRDEEPEEVRIREGSTLSWGVRKAIERAGRVPDLIFDLGAVGKEPMIRLIGKEPAEVVEKALKIASII